MLEIKGVHGSEEASAPLIVGPTTVYVHFNVEEEIIENEMGESYTEYVYDEIQYTKDEYIQLMAERNEQLTNSMDDVILTIADLVGV